MVEFVFLSPIALPGIIAFFWGAGSRTAAVTGALHLFLSVLIWTFRPGAAFPDYFAVSPRKDCFPCW
jgi:hypothetical protein